MTILVTFGTQVGYVLATHAVNSDEGAVLQLTMTGEYAIRTMLHLASLRFGTVAQLSDISKEWDIPGNFLRKISAHLSRAGLVASQRGLGGGVTLGRPAEVISLLDIIEAVEGKISLNKCLICDESCPRDTWCAVHLVWGEAQMKLKEVLAAKSLAQLASQSAERKATLEEASHRMQFGPQLVK